MVSSSVGSKSTLLYCLSGNLDSFFSNHASICTSSVYHWKNIAQKPCSKVLLGKKMEAKKRRETSSRTWISSSSGAAHREVLKQAPSHGYLHLQELHTAKWWFTPLGGCTILFVWWQDITMELRSAFSTSSEASLLSKHITYSITALSQGSVILPSLVNPNSSCDSFRSSTNTAVWR
jgi:hypothetical protein|uniref:Uncharacterized protein n=1 Tax=Zea mays TaxID=4577 RepID=A0A804NRH2_MAIZE